jgi:AcrR family transcriptional regulator
VAAAIEIADAEGLAAVSMARVAAQVGASTMALYRYVATKDELLLLMSDAGLGLPPTFPGRRGWRARLEQWARSVREGWLQRPWLLQIPVNGPPAGPNNIAWFDAGLAALSATRLPNPERVSLVLLVSTYVRGDAWLNVDLVAASTNDPDSLAFDYANEEYVPLVDPARYPALAALIAAGDSEDPDLDPFDLGLTVILDGIAQRIEATAAAG